MEIVKVWYCYATYMSPDFLDTQREVLIWAHIAKKLQEARASQKFGANGEIVVSNGGTQLLSDWT